MKEKTQSTGTNPLHQSVAGKLKFKVGTKSIAVDFTDQRISARLARQWCLCGETGEVTRILRQLQTIRLGSIHLKNEDLQLLQQITKVPVHLNAQLAKLKLLHLFAAPPAWAKNAEPTQP